MEDLGERLKVLIGRDGQGAELVQALTYQGFQYASHIIPEVADTPKPLDDAIRWGFGHEAGPFEIWDMLGVRETVEEMKAAGFPPAAWVEEMLPAGVKTFYQYDKAGGKVGVYDVANERLYSHRPDARIGDAYSSQASQKGDHRKCRRDLFDMGDGVACVEFHTKMNALDDDIFKWFMRAWTALRRISTAW